MNLRHVGALPVGVPSLQRVVNSSPTTTDLIGNGYAMTAELIKAQIDKLANDCYEEGWNDCLKQMSEEPFSAARTRQLEINYDKLRTVRIIQERRLTLAVRLLRLAQRSECGKLGQYDRFFEEGFHQGIEEDA
jgi:hypothetical protein